jgi:hypothetical protein
MVPYLFMTLNLNFKCKFNFRQFKLDQFIPIFHFFEYQTHKIRHDRDLFSWLDPSI